MLLNVDADDRVQFWVQHNNTPWPAERFLNVAFKLLEDKCTYLRATGVVLNQLMSIITICLDLEKFRSFNDIGKSVFSVYLSQVTWQAFRSFLAEHFNVP